MRSGKIRFKHVGPLTDAVAREKLIPMITRLGAPSGAAR